MSEEETYSYVGTQQLLESEVLRNYHQAIANDIVRYAPRAGARTLDFGAGIGSLARLVRAAGLDVECMEPDRGQRETIASSLGTAVYASLEDVADASFDYVYSSNVLEHIEDDGGALRTLFRILRPGGRVFMYVPAFMVLYSGMDRAVGHHRRYVRSSLREKMNAAGFRVEAMRYADFLGFFATLAFKAISNDVGDANPRTLMIYDRFVFPVSRVIETLPVPFGKNVLAVASRP